ncbi:MAG: biotin--[acetyl-CoA-carboxylase] ligase [Elusimicrobiota bacterium]|jgi:BirA family biotin operon repressor/biotin-[acetyl-CoA-carboxylase] ligase|nr:biotin--[acetyl-CoA-carboxylase] ligase [Elusimicrobiota bacterium]
MIKILKYKTIDSTQTKAKHLADNGAAAWTLIMAQKQSKGYGRLKRNWSSDEGGLWFSFILKPDIKAQDIQKISFIISVALIRVLKKLYGISAKIKWVNDIFYRNKKIAGIIVESSLEKDKVKWIIVGVGINVNNDLPLEFNKIACPLKNILKKKLNIEKLLSDFLTEFKSAYADFLLKGFEYFVQEYNRNLKFLNKKVAISVSETDENKIEGINKGIDKNGLILIETKDSNKKISTGTLRQCL